MLRVGLTGELGSGKSTVARLLQEHGAEVLSSDEMGRAMMQPGEPVYRAIVERFGQGVVRADGSLDRVALAALAFAPGGGRVEELNAIVHPAVIAEQEQRIAEIARERPGAVVVVESALLLTTQHAGGEAPWRRRFDRVVVVTAPDVVKVERFVARMAAGRALSEAERDGLRQDAAGRLAAQRIPEHLLAECTVLENTGDFAALEAAVKPLWRKLAAAAAG